MKNKKTKKVRSSGSLSFWVFNMMLIAIILGAVLLSVFGKGDARLPLGADYRNVIGVSSQVITAIVSLVVSIIGIAISLQNEEYLGVKVTKLYALRVKKHYSILSIILISIFLCALNLVFYMMDLTIAALGVLLVALLFLVKVVCSEIPIMTKNETAMLNILKDNLVYCHANNEEATKDLKDAIKSLLYVCTFKDAYNSLKDNSDEKLNQYILMKLLELQHDLAFDLKDKYGQAEQHIIGDILIRNVADIVQRDIEVSDEQYKEVAANKYLLTRVLFRTYELEPSRQNTIKQIAGLYHSLSFVSDEHKTQTDCELIASIIIIFVAETVKKGDFNIIKEIRKNLSSWEFGLADSSYYLDIFAVLSLFLYYLCNSDGDTPPEIKEKIKIFITESGMIEDNTRIVSWRSLFSVAAENFNVDYDRFIKIALNNDHTMEYWLLGIGSKRYVLDRSYLLTWYLTNLLNSYRADKLDFAAFPVDDETRYSFKDFGSKCFAEDNQFIPTEEMKQIIAFYSDDANPFALFEVMEKHNHSFFNHINGIKLEDLKKESVLAREVDMEEHATKIRAGIEASLEKEWGFDSSLTISNSERYISVMLHKYPEEHFADSLTESCIRSIKSDIKKAVPKTVIYKDDGFDANVRFMLSNNLKYATHNSMTTFPNLYISDGDLRQEFVDVCASLSEFKSGFLGFMSLVTDGGFRFNYKVEKVELRCLTEDELSEQVSEYQRSDGQYVYEGTFMPREEITNIIRDTIAVLTIIFKHQVAASENTVFELRPHSTGPND